ncbi:unnamed protein product [Miscanthus lutarioriparius]|uniref:Tim10-like domain-containing protein n=1 Tax=Miscanthus lutarioriparius TaxID=422564 RepID=A0A811PJH6_9POAL|nr:unnamed protein product [Miscanthus lutarioriparius]
MRYRRACAAAAAAAAAAAVVVILAALGSEHCGLGLFRCCASLLDDYKQEQQKAMMNEMVGKLTSVCWDKCITSAPGSKFSSGESTCLTNCAQRFLDMSMLIAKRFEMQRTLHKNGEAVPYDPKYHEEWVRHNLHRGGGGPGYQGEGSDWDDQGKGSDWDDGSDSDYQGQGSDWDDDQ